MRYATICSGIGAPEQAWRGLWGLPVFTSEIDKFPSAVLKHHYPDIPNYGDMTNYKEWPNHELGLICGGTPCQSFSVAGLRKGMDDPRGNLTLTFLGILARYNPRWFVWENVPGVLSSNGGRDFAGFLRGLQELGYSCAYRVLDAQYFGVPQRRRRVFLVGHLGDDWRPPFAVLFEPESLRGNIAPSREAGEEVARSLAIGIDEECNASINKYGPLLLRGGQGGTRQAVSIFENHPADSRISECKDGNAPTITSRFGTDGGNVPLVHAIHPHAIGRKDEAGPQAKPYRTDDKAYTHDGRGVAQAVAFNSDQSEKTRSMGESVEQCPTLRSGGTVSVAFKVRCGCEGGGKGYLGSEEKAFTVSTSHDQDVFAGSTVRRLTPIECERLQGFPDNFTRIPWRGKAASECPDGPRYKALGNSMAVPVVRWIGRRIQIWEELPTLPLQKCRP
jgi:DNA (cytosine-5)-methyltransferase 1